MLPCFRGFDSPIGELRLLYKSMLVCKVVGGNHNLSGNGIHWWVLLRSCTFCSWVGEAIMGSFVLCGTIGGCR